MQKRVNIPISDALKRRIEKIAKTEKRSFQAQAAKLLEEAVAAAHPGLTEVK